MTQKLDDFILHIVMLLKVSKSRKQILKFSFEPKMTKKNVKDFCPMYCKNSQGRNPSNVLGHFLEIDDS